MALIHRATLVPGKLDLLSGWLPGQELVDVDGHLEPRDPTATVVGSGTPGSDLGDPTPVSVVDQADRTVVSTPTHELAVVRRGAAGQRERAQSSQRYVAGGGSG